MPHDLETVRANVARALHERHERLVRAARERREAAEAAERQRRKDAAERRRARRRARYVPRPRRGRRQTERTRALLREAERRRAAERALADPSTSVLRRARIERRMTIEQVAEAAGLHRNSVGTAERGGYVSEETWAKLVALFGSQVRP